MFCFYKKKVVRYLSLKHFDKIQLKTLLKYSVPLIPNALSWWVLVAADRTIVSGYLGTDVNGLVTVAHKIPGAVQSIFNVFIMSWTESVSLHINDKENNKFFSEVINNVFKLSSCLAIGIVVCLPFVYDLLIDSAYKESKMLVPLFMIASMLNMVQGLYSCIYVALKKTREIANSTIISAVINIVSHLVLIGFIGMYAAPVSTILGYGVMTVYRYFDIKKYIDVPLKASSIIAILLLLAVTMASYYYGNTAVSAIVLFIVAVYSLIANRSFLKSALLMFKKKIKKES